ncbi:MAG: hypothetical protein EP318_15250 [Rhodobacteraceae bacterium]|nr:MAG: hypothetical protein EP318_15250 [Paracoccaceae bacterium]
MTETSPIDLAVRHLRRALEDLNRELAGYPGPIAGCDAQYTHLLSTRTRVRNALAALEAEVFVATPRSLFPGAGIESR